jgi:hypothetical protein
VRAASKYWVWKAADFSPAQAAQRLSGYLEYVADLIVGKEELHLNLEELSAKIEETLLGGNLTDDQRVPLLVVYAHWHMTVLEKARRPNYMAVISRHVADTRTCRLEMMVLHLLLFQSLPWPVVECLQVYRSFARRRFHKTTFDLPQLIEVALLFELSNLCLRESRFDDRTAMLDMAYFEAAGWWAAQSAAIEAQQHTAEVDWWALWQSDQR